jgi:Mce-associated membrane protein
MTERKSRHSAADDDDDVDQSADSLDESKTAISATDKAQPKQRVRVLAAVGALLLVAAIALAGFFFLQFKSKNDTLSAQESARNAACAYGNVLGDFDFKNIDTFFTRVLDGGTGDWKTQYTAQKEALRKLYTDGQVVSKVKSVDCAVTSGDEDHAETIIVLGQTIATAMEDGKPQDTSAAMMISFDKVDGKWLVSKVNSPGAPTVAK